MGKVTNKNIGSLFLTRLWRIGFVLVVRFGWFQVSPIANRKEKTCDTLITKKSKYAVLKSKNKYNTFYGLIIRLTRHSKKTLNTIKQFFFQFSRKKIDFWNRIWFRNLYNLYYYTIGYPFHTITVGYFNGSFGKTEIFHCNIQSNHSGSNLKTNINCKHMQRIDDLNA